MKVLIFLVLLVNFASAKTYTDVPADARKVLESLPRKSVSLDYITQVAMLNSDTFRALRAQFAIIEVPELTAKAPLELNLESGYTFTHSEDEPDSPFFPTRLENSQWNLGFSKYFSTGTAVGVSMVQGRYSKTMPSPFQNPAFDDIHKTVAEVSISQNLWRDAFGFSTRRNLTRGKLETEVKRIEVDESMEDWLLGLAHLYYRGWGAQSDTRAAEAGLARRQRLLNITQRKVSSGTGERPDLLQVRSAVSGSSIRLQVARENLDSFWREIVILLKLPQPWMSIDPLLIPVELDNPTDMAVNLCVRSQPTPAPTINSSYRKALLQKDAANLAYEAARNSANPQLSLNFVGGGNGVDATSRPTAMSEATSFEHPHYSGMLIFKMGLNQFQAEAQVRQAMAVKEMSEAKASQAKGSFESEWLATCDQLVGWQQRVSTLRQVVENQKERVALEESRFRLGRVPLINVIQSGDDQTDAEINFNNAQIQFRLAAWKIRRLSGLAKTYLEGFIHKARAENKIEK